MIYYELAIFRKTKIQVYQLFISKLTIFKEFKISLIKKNISMKRVAPSANIV